MKITKSFANKAGELSRTLNEEAIALVISVDDKEVIRVGLGELSDKLIKQAALHGLSQKIGDAASGWKQAGTDPVAMMEAVASQIVSQEVWNKVRTGDGSPQTSLLIEALMKVAGKDKEACQDVIDGLTKEQISALRKRPTIAAAIAEIKLARQKAAAEAAAKAAADSDDDIDNLF